MSEKACPVCHIVTSGNACPKCKTTGLSDDFSGIVIIFDPANSAIARAMNIAEKGRYALKVR
ncbi:MAG: transcription elongation factor Spt4 [Candidatus Bathyarchaeota archaeon]|nr:transcription elongation factor Spt4 [Candidatus Bathyarchaeota archaeon]MCX8176814.1 transcription elongation factor Spt4 [Candidatus Bathyarchaeota archaeon]MDW8193343.1 transcription elongation factor subunit Spt4 [Nitrososphaerota archaeon]